jgi:hypothetical protein
VPLSSFFHVSADGHFIVQGFQILPRQLEPIEAPSRDASMTNLSLPNPFKALKSKSSENDHLSDHKGKTGRVMLEEKRDLGVVLTQGLPSGYRAYDRDGIVISMVWSHQELTVRCTAILLTHWSAFTQCLHRFSNIAWVSFVYYARKTSKESKMFNGLMNPATQFYLRCIVNQSVVLSPSLICNHRVVLHNLGFLPSDL